MCLKVLLAPGFALLSDAQAEARQDAAFLEFERFVHFQRRHHREFEQLAHHGIAIAIGEGYALEGGEAGDPREHAAIVERSQFSFGKHKAAFDQQDGILQFHALFAAAQGTGDVPLIALVLADLEPELPGLALLPGQGLGFAAKVVAEEQAAGGSQHRDEALRERKGNRLAGGPAGGGAVGIHIVFLAAEDGCECVGVERIGQGADLRWRDAEFLQHGPVARLFAGSRVEFEDDGACGSRGRDIDHVNDCEIPGPGGGFEFFRLQAGADVGQIFLPGGCARRLVVLRAAKARRRLRTVFGLGVAHQAEGGGLGSLTQDAALIAFENRRPEVFAAAGIGEGGAGAIHAEDAIVIGDPDGVTVAAHDVAEEVRLVGVRHTDGMAVEEIQALELKSSFKLEC